jgi:hypothetical protein
VERHGRVPEHLLLGCIRRVSLLPFPVSPIYALANVRLPDASLYSDEALIAQLSRRFMNPVHQRSFAVTATNGQRWQRRAYSASAPLVAVHVALVQINTQLEDKDNLRLVTPLTVHAIVLISLVAAAAAILDVEV